MITITWICGIVSALIVFMGGGEFTTEQPCQGLNQVTVSYCKLALAILVIPLIIIAIIHCLVLVAVRKQLNKISPETGALSGVTADLKRHLHVIKTFFIIVGIFVICWAPFFYRLGISPNFDTGSLEGPSRLVTSMMIILNSAANPFIYALRMKAFRGPMKSILCFCCHKNTE